MYNYYDVCTRANYYGLVYNILSMVYSDKLIIAAANSKYKITQLWLVIELAEAS
jgi:hypothetical protein